MKITSFLFLLLLGINYSIAQKSNSVSIGVQASADYSYRFLEKNNLRQKPGFGFTAGIPVIIPISNVFQLETGFYYADRRFSSGRNYEKNRTDNYVIDQKFLSLEVPVRLNMQLGKGNIKFITSAGVAGGYDKVYLEKNFYQSTSIVYPTERQFKAQIEAGAGVSFSNSSNFSFPILPIYRIYINKTPFPLKGSGQRLWNLGLNAGILYNL